MPTWIRVKDPSTKHEFDVLETSPLLRKELVKPVKSDRYPPSPVPRRRKYHTDRAGQSATRSTDVSPGTPAEATSEEN